jgi:hypothetical protein
MFNLIRIAIDNNIISWKAFPDLQPAIQKDDRMRCDYIAIKRLFELQEQYPVVLVAVDQVYREASRTSDESKRTKLRETLKLCKEKFYLTRFQAVTSPKGAAKARGKSGINLEDGSFWITKNGQRKIDEYIAIGQNEEEKRDLEVLATVAIAGVRRFATVDYNLLDNNRIKEYIQREDGIFIYRPSEILKRLETSHPEVTTEE